MGAEYLIRRMKPSGPRARESPRGRKPIGKEAATIRIVLSPENVRDLSAGVAGIVARSLSDAVEKADRRNP